MTTTLAIETRGLTRHFGHHIAVRDVGLSVPANCVYGFLGPNGAGKTTTIRMLLGLLKPDRGVARLFGHDVSTDRIAALRQVGAIVEAPALYDHLSGYANLDITRRMLSLAASEIDRVLEIVDLGPDAHRRVGGYSLGMKQRLGLARALLGSPRLLLLDEPTNGLDPEGIVTMRALIRDLPARIGGSVLMSSHLLGEVEQVATRVGLMLSGELVLQDDLAALLRKDHLLRVEVDDRDRASAIARAMDVPVVDDGEDALTLSIDVARHDELPAKIIRTLIEAGLAVSAAVPSMHTLEHVYRSVLADRARVEVA